MKTTVKFFSLAAFSLLLLLSVSCSNKSAQDTTAKEEHTGECCEKAASIDENAIMIVATITVKDEADKPAIEAALHRVVDGTRTEEGNVLYDLHQDINNPLKYIIYEVWKSQEAINFHNQTPHFKALGGELGDKASVTAFTMKKVY